MLTTRYKKICDMIEQNGTEEYPFDVEVLARLVEVQRLYELVEASIDLCGELFAERCTQNEFAEIFDELIEDWLENSGD